MEEFGKELVALLPRLRRFARSLAGTADRADDLVQTACAKAIAAKATWQPGTRFDAWMFRIVRNAWVDGLRRDRTFANAGDDELEHLQGPGGEDAQLARLTLAAVLATIDQLPPDQREVLLLVAMEDFSYAEVAEMLDAPIGTVMSRLARARKKIASAAGIDRPSKR